VFIPPGRSFSHLFIDLVGISFACFPVFADFARNFVFGPLNADL